MTVECEPRIAMVEERDAGVCERAAFEVARERYDPVLRRAVVKHLELAGVGVSK
jgi:hypothetical protein